MCILTGNWRKDTLSVMTQKDRMGGSRRRGYMYACMLAKYTYIQASQVALVVKNPSTNAGDRRDQGLILESRRSPGADHGNPL